MPIREPTLAERTAALLRGVDILIVPHDGTVELIVTHQFCNTRPTGNLYFRCYGISDYGKKLLKGAVCDHWYIGGDGNKERSIGRCQGDFFSGNTPVPEMLMLTENQDAP